ncbi:endonuclease domain-containing protein [Blastococcus goldschmidtiae]|uniref:DUF559 domain-containing protein n=1 Tax=Blastococcus goldschmidtiae TaxID=3075546 RepID=A0ABU2K6D6_9ACTN|nr:DUF559 domain-containing protein [Blastococcus sp. DSM 46792]MDT0275732.1 DUF559 domain-containing protein [Blastococcus sp. DSM 46792]
MPPPHVPALLRRRLFRGTAVVRAGLLTHRQLDGPTWRRLFRDVYVHAQVPVTHELRVRGAVLLLPDAVVTGRSAAVLWGVPLADACDDVELTLPPDSHQRRIPGLVVRRAVLQPEDHWRRGDVPVTTAEATAVRLAAALPTDRAVAAVDQLVASGVVDLAPVRARAARERGPGAAHARTVCALADGLAQSPQETRLRLLMHRHGVPPPVAQYRVMVRDRFVARVDFAWPERRLAVEYDGAWHGEPAQLGRDRHRLNRLRAAGWQVVFVTAADWRRPTEIIATIMAALDA